MLSVVDLNSLAHVIFALSRRMQYLASFLGNLVCNCFSVVIEAVKLTIAKTVSCSHFTRKCAVILSNRGCLVLSQRWLGIRKDIQLVRNCTAMICGDFGGHGPSPTHASVLFCSLAVLNPRVGHTMDLCSPFIFVLCHFD